MASRIDVRRLAGEFLVIVLGVLAALAVDDFRGARSDVGTRYGGLGWPGEKLCRCEGIGDRPLNRSARRAQMFE